MKLERYKDKKETRKKVILISLTVLTLISVTMVLYKTFAKFTATTSFPIMSGKVKYKKKSFELGTDIPPIADSSGNGLFAVTPTGPSEDWKKTEYRYAGPNPNNYVYFNCNNGQVENNTNCELWRIIGKVNVKTSTGNIEQRLKIIRSESLGNYAWDINIRSDWTKSSLKDMLNGGYYSSLSGVTCYTAETNSFDASYTTCSFDEKSNTKGLTSLARDMIDNSVIWNLGGWDNSGVKAEDMYKYERGTTVYSGNQPEWTLENDSTYHRGVGLMYPSDYGYAVGGSVREFCLKLTLFDYSSGNCSINDWLYINSDYRWALTTFNRGAATLIGPGGGVGSYATIAACAVHPVVYLNSNVKLGEGEGTQQTPYHLSGI